MRADLDAIVTHDSTDNCIACRSQDLVAQALVPASEAWESANGLPPMSLALHGAAGLIGRMLAGGVPRQDVEKALAILIDEIEQLRAEDEMMGGPPQGTA